MGKRKLTKKKQERTRIQDIPACDETINVLSSVKKKRKKSTPTEDNVQESKMIEAVDRIYSDADLQKVSMKEMIDMVLKEFPSGSRKDKKQKIRDRILFLVSSRKSSTYQNGSGLNLDKDKEENIVNCMDEDKDKGNEISSEREAIIDAVDSLFHRIDIHNVKVKQVFKELKTTCGFDEMVIKRQKKIIRYRLADLVSNIEQPKSYNLRNEEKSYAYGNQNDIEVGLNADNYLKIDEKKRIVTTSNAISTSERSIKPVSIKKLEHIKEKGFIWRKLDRKEVLNKAWDESLRELIDYKEKYGNCAVPQNYGKLGSWVQEQRVQYRQKLKGSCVELTEFRIKLLNSMGFIWAIKYNSSWEQSYEVLKLFFMKYKHCNVPRNFAENHALAFFVKEQRAEYSKLMRGEKSTMNSERIQLLESIGFKWSQREDVWNTRFEELLAFSQEFGHTKVPRSYINKQLSSWVNYQRSQFKYFIDGKKSNLTKERILKLQSIGFVWNVQRRHNPWKKNFEEFKTFKALNGNFYIPCNFKTNPILGVWAHNQRSAYQRGTLDKERIDALNEEGFFWHPDKAIKDVKI